MTTAGDSDHVLTKIQTMLVSLGANLERMDLREESARACVAMGGIMLVAAALVLFRVGSAEVCSSNEAVEGLVVQQMIEHGELLFPVLNGHAPMFKPPLFHWTATAIAHVLGIHQVTEISLRLPSVVFGLACVLLTMLFVRGWLGVPNAALSGLVLLASYQFVIEARFGRVDMALTFCESLSLFAFLWWLRARDLGHDHSRASIVPMSRSALAHYLFAVALGLGVLAKGPVGLVLPLTTALVFLLVERRWADVRALGSPGPLLALGLVSSSWYLAGLWERRLDLLHRQIVSENFSRFVGDIHTMSPLYYLKPLLLNSGPLSILTIIAVVGALRGRTSRGARSGTAIDEHLRAYFLALFWVLTVVFFSIAAYKRRAYLLPLWPPAAVLLVWWLNFRVVEQRRQLAKGAVVALCGALIVFNLLYIPHAERSACGSARYREAAAVINHMVPYNVPLYIDDPSTESASLLFYLDRTVPVLDGTLANTPKGYVLVPEPAWQSQRATTALRPVATVTLERRRLVLLESQLGSAMAEAPSGAPQLPH